MRKLFTFIICTVLFTSFSSAQEVVKGGDMEDASVWNFYYNVLQDGELVQEMIYATEEGNTATISDLADGDYTFEVEAVDNFGNVSSSETDVHVGGNSVDDVLAGFKVYPNPSNGVVNVVSGTTLKTIQNSPDQLFPFLKVCSFSTLPWPRQYDGFIISDSI
ncbi:MAG: hypothetical protein K9H26_08075 [Prolixibacteraceae bacterium]|nr:hypothetical protein [Prolixibacteraceae bacterium]